MIAHFERLLEISEIFGAREALEKLPAVEVFTIYSFRHRIKVLGGPEAKVFPGTVGTVRNVLDTLFLDKETCEFQGFDGEVLMRDYFTYLLGLYHWYRLADDIDPDLKKLLDEKLKPLVSLSEDKDNPEKKLDIFLELVSSLLSKSPEKLVVFLLKESQTDKSFQKPFMSLRIMVRFLLTETRKVCFEDRHTTEVFRVVGWKYGGGRVLQLKADDISDLTLMKGLKLDVYMQDHALKRLNERLDLFSPGELYYNVGISIEESNVVTLGPDRGLIGYYFYGYLLGYLLTEVIDGIAVIRTFLFLTNDDTPQGKKLHQLLRSNKLDKSYTGLDQLSTFIYGNLKEDDKLYSLLKEAGCSVLLNLNENLIERAAERAVALDARSIRKYFELND